MVNDSSSQANEIDVPATKGHEKAPITVLQGHLDMVCEKNSGTQHDFDRDPIRLVLDKDAKGEAIVRADGTDNGAWFARGHLWVQNEETGGRVKPSQSVKRAYATLLGSSP